MLGTPLNVVLEFARADQSGDPYGFRFAPQEYLLRGAGGGFESSRLVWDQSLLADLDALRSPVRDPALLSRIGELLRQFLVPLGWAQHEQQILSACDRGAPIVVTICSAAAELYALPWELVTLKATGQHLGELPSLLLRYEWPETATAREQPAPREAGGRILVAWSAAGGSVPASEHLAAIQSACTASTYPFDPGRDVLAHVTCRRLADTMAAAHLAGAPIAVLHLLCHGAAAGSTFGLALDAESGGTSIVDAGRLRQLLAPYAGSLRLVILAACDGGNPGALGNQLGSIAQALHRAGIATVIASRYPLSVSGSIAFSRAFYSHLLAVPASLESAVLTGRRRLAQDAAKLDWASVQLYARRADGEDTRPVVFRPYRGLASFLPSDRRFYFGRERDVERIVKLLSGSARLVTVVGASGAGKSSLILAGVVPALSAGASGPPRVRIVRPGTTPCLALATALAAADDPTRANPSPEIAIPELRDKLLHARDALSALAAHDPTARMLLIVDQAEELFLQSERAEASAFIDNVVHAISDAHGCVSVVLTLRADFLGLCLERPALAEPVRATMELILPLDKEELRQVILRPAALVGLKFEEGLVDALLDALWDTEAATAGGAESASAPSDPARSRTLASRAAGSLPLLSFTLEQLWERRSGQTITWQSWRTIGGVRGAIARRANEVLEQSRSAGEQALVQKLFGRLVQLGDGTVDTRRRARREEIEAIAPGRMKPVVARWVEARLLTADESEVTIAHEALLREWETLRRWIDESRESLRILHLLSRDARRYAEGGRNPDDLWRGTPLRQALRLQASGQLSLSGEEAEFLGDSVQEAERQHTLVEEQAKQHRDRDVGIGETARSVLILSLVAFGVGTYAWARHSALQITHGMFLIQLFVLGVAGLLVALLLRKGRFDNEWNRKTILVCVSVTVPLFINHLVGRAFGFDVNATQILDLNTLSATGILAAITIDTFLWRLALWDLFGLALAFWLPQRIGMILAFFPLSGLLYYILVNRKRIALQKPGRKSGDITAEYLALRRSQLRESLSGSTPPLRESTGSHPSPFRK